MCLLVYFRNIVHSVKTKFNGEVGALCARRVAAWCEGGGVPFCSVTCLRRRGAGRGKEIAAEGIQRAGGWDGWTAVRFGPNGVRVCAYVFAFHSRTHVFFFAFACAGCR